MFLLLFAAFLGSVSANHLQDSDLEQEGTSLLQRYFDGTTSKDLAGTMSVWLQEDNSYFDIENTLYIPADYDNGMFVIVHSPLRVVGYANLVTGFDEYFTYAVGNILDLGTWKHVAARDSIVREDYETVGRLRYVLAAEFLDPSLAELSPSRKPWAIVFGLDDFTFKRDRSSGELKVHQIDNLEMTFFLDYIRNSAVDALATDEEKIIQLTAYAKELQAGPAHQTDRMSRLPAQYRF